MLLNCEIVLSSAGEVEAVFDVSAQQSLAIRDALMRYRASRFVGALTEATDVQRLRALDAINEQAQTLALADAASVMRLSLAHTEILDEATQLYLRDRDRESYQPPEERARIATLNELALPLMQLILDLRVRVQYLQERPPELAIA